MRILFVAFSESIHTARWLKQLASENWDIHLFPAEDVGVTHPQLTGVTVHHSFYGHNKNWPTPKGVQSRGLNVGHRLPAAALRLLTRKINPNYRVDQLATVIKEVKPDLIHSLEMQHGAYLVNEVRKRWNGQFPKWLVTNWGSDIYYFAKDREHRQKIREVLKYCDYYSCECQRDIKLAQKHGFKGECLPVLPNTGGFDLKAIHKLRAPGRTSQRRVIALKGYQNWAGRALIGLQALEQCRKLLDGYEVVLYSVIPANSGVIEAAAAFSKSTGISTRILPARSPHEEILKLHGRARISIGLSMSDGISTSFLEALAMGSFPIQSNTACADEWIECGKTGLIVPPENVATITRSIRQALTDDGLVDSAATKNWTTAQKRLNKEIIANRVRAMYHSILES